MTTFSDFDPATGHKETCDVGRKQGLECNKDCANILYSMMVRMEDVMAEWDRLCRGVGPTTRTLRTARDHQQPGG